VNVDERQPVYALEIEGSLHLNGCFQRTGPMAPTAARAAVLIEPGAGR
jgi:hypothetical protein